MIKGNRKSSIRKFMAKKIQNQITEDTSLAKILEYPKAQKILAKYNLPCLSCPMAAFETGLLKIGRVCKMYDINLKKLLKELNSLC